VIGSVLWSQVSLFNGGHLILGYDVDLNNKGHRIINASESEQVRTIFEMYLKAETVSKTLKIIYESTFTRNLQVPSSQLLEGKGGKSTCV